MTPFEKIISCNALWQDINLALTPFCDSDTEKGHHPSSVWPLIGWSIISLASHWPNTIKEKWRSPSDAVVNDDVTWRSPRDVVMMSRSSEADLCATRLWRAVGAHCNQLKFSIAYISTFLNNFVSRILWSKLGNQAAVSLRENISKAWVKVRGS